MAKAIATNVPRRKLLKLLAGGVVAAVGGSIAGGTASAQSRPGFYYQQYKWVCEPELNPVFNPVLNQVIEEPTGEEDCHLEVTYGRAVPWWSAFYPGRSPAFGFGVNGSFPE
ncbi:MAG TPA: hypothetical protein VHA53_03185 [Nitrolancea sp.]|nr:hypothetical protein [Nitrolancea sp.]